MPDVKPLHVEILSSVSVALYLLVIGCAHGRPQLGEIATHQSACTVKQVDVALARFSQAIRRMDSAAIAAQFTETGSMADQGQHPIVGRAAIHAFLASFEKFKVLQYHIRATSTSVQDRHAAQHGQYNEVVVTPNGDTVQPGGVFEAEWVCNSEGVWQMDSMRTARDDTKPSD